MLNVSGILNFVKQNYIYLESYLFTIDSILAAFLFQFMQMLSIISPKTPYTNNHSFSLKLNPTHKTKQKKNSPFSNFKLCLLVSPPPPSPPPLRIAPLPETTDCQLLSHLSLQRASRCIKLRSAASANTQTHRTLFCLAETFLIYLL